MLSNKIISFVQDVCMVIEEVSHYENSLNINGLVGYCGISSRFLIALARKNNIHNMKLVCGTFNGAVHCWVHYDKYCIDVTISQFNPFDKLKYKICIIGDEFYKLHYKPDVIGSPAIRRQKKWREQAYGRYALTLWDTYRNMYMRG